MEPHKKRKILPRGNDLRGFDASTAISLTSQSTKSNQTRQRHSQENWEAQKNNIIKLYITDDLHVDIVLERLKSEHNFPVGRRKFLEMVKKWKLSKNLGQSEMLILIAKQDARMRQGRKTEFMRNGQVIDDGRLDRFRNRDFVRTVTQPSPSAETPSNVTYYTPRQAMGGPSSAYVAELEAILEKLFGSGQMILKTEAFLPIHSSDLRSRTHIHQFGVFGIMHPESAPHVNHKDILRRALDLASSLAIWTRKPSFNIEDPKRTTRKTLRVPKFYFKLMTPRSFSDVDITSIHNQLKFQLKHSSLCHQLLGLQNDDIKAWKQPWVEMSSEERESTETIASKYFGSTDATYPTMDTSELYILMQLPARSGKVIFLRSSIVFDHRGGPECDVCERDIVAFDCIGHLGPVQVNVPLRRAPSSRCLPGELVINKSIGQEIWSLSMKGWPRHLPCKRNHDGVAMDELCSADHEHCVEPGYWDPMASSEPPTIFRPDDLEKTYWRRKRAKEEQFDADPSNKDRWEPLGIAPLGIHISDSDDDSDDDGDNNSSSD